MVWEWGGVRGGSAGAATQIGGACHGDGGFGSLPRCRQERHRGGPEKSPEPAGLDSEVRADETRMYTVRNHAGSSLSPGKVCREHHQRQLGLTIGGQHLIRSPVEQRFLKIDGSMLMRLRRNVHPPPPPARGLRLAC